MRNVIITITKFFITANIFAQDKERNRWYFNIYTC